MKGIHILVLTFLTLCIGTPTYAQNPIKWNFEVVSLGESNYKFVAKADIDNGWVLYSQHTDEGGPVATSFNFDTADGLRIEGDVTEKSNLISAFDPLFEIVVKKFKKEAIFETLFKIEGEVPAIKGYVTFMTCDGQKCLPPRDIPFVVAL